MRQMGRVPEAEEIIVRMVVRAAAAGAIGLTMGLAGGLPAYAAGGPPDPSAVNGGDHGYGNCGFNSSGGVSPSGQRTPGNGGYTKADDCTGGSSTSGGSVTGGALTGGGTTTY